MAALRLPMRRLREILRLKHECGLSHRAIALACGVGAGTVSEYLRRARQGGLTWPLPEEQDDAALEARLFPVPRGVLGPRPLPDPAWLHQELKRPGVTLQLLWLEYAQVHPDGYRYSQFCEHYRRFARTLAPTMRQVHRAGEKAFVDFSGKRPEIVDRRTGEARPVELFVGVLGASSYLYAEVTEDQSLAAFIAAHVHMLEDFGGCPELLVPDNLKAGVTRACRYEPQVNRTYEDMARHYGAAVLPARAYRPRDKPKVEAGVLVSQRWILARLRDRTFFSVAEMNAAVQELRREINDRPMKHLGASRRELFERLDRPALRPLPETRYEMATWKECGVNIDYHIDVDHVLYSVPYQLIHKRVEARLTATTVEVSTSRAAGSRRTSVSSAAAGTPPSRSTCPAPIGRTPSGPRRASSPGPGRPVPPPLASCRRSSTAVPTPSRATAPASASCVSARRAAPTASKPPACGPSISGRIAIAPSRTSSPPDSTASRSTTLPPHPCRRTPTSAAPPTTKETDRCSPSPPWTA